MNTFVHTLKQLPSYWVYGFAFMAFVGLIITGFTLRKVLKVEFYDDEQQINESVFMLVVGLFLLFSGIILFSLYKF